MHTGRWLGLAAVLLAGCSGHQLLNTLTPSSGYGVVGGVEYDAAQHLRLDLYVPQGARDAPVAVFLYGGRWTEGSRLDYRFVGQALASEGILAVVPDYRRYPEVRFPVFVQDAARAVRWAHENTARYGGDPARLFVIGHSAGAHIAAMLALNPAFLSEAGGDRAWLRGMVGLAGPYDFLPITAPDLRDIFGPPERFPESQPINFCDGENPPLLLLHGENDEIVRVKNTRNLAAAVARAGGSVETVIYPEMGHAWIIATVAAPLRGASDVLEHVARFVHRHSASREAEVGSQ